MFIFYKPLHTYPVSFITEPDVIPELNYKHYKLASNHIKCLNYSNLHRPSIITNSGGKYYLSEIVGAMGSCLN